mgnify:FL=1
MAYTDIDDPTIYFDTKLYTGTGSNNVTLTMDNLGLLWIKNRTESINHSLFDSLRGGYYVSGSPSPIIRSNTNQTASGSDITSTYGIAFGSSSSTIGSDGGGYNYNQSGKSYVGWQWRAGTSVSGNTTGSGTAKAYSGSVSTTSGFSIIKYVGNGTEGHTIPHHLGAIPQMLIIKNLSATTSWVVYHHKNTSAPATDILRLDTTAATADDASMFADTVPTSTVFTLGSTSSCNSNDASYVCYAFSGKQGYSKFGGYTGNASTDGTFVYTGFKPAFVMFKKSAGTGSWAIQDNKRTPFNVQQIALFANTTAAESNSADNNVDFLSNGFKFRSDTANYNTNGDAYIYMAFAENPFVTSTGVPATAR